MEKKINIAELLKDCPKGMELDCTMYDNVTFISVDKKSTIFPIKVLRPDGCEITLTEYGQYAHMNDAKCVIFPKGKTTWEGFQRPFEDGDIVATTPGKWIGITKGGKNNCFLPVYCVIKSDGEFEAYFDREEFWAFDRLAIEEEKAKLFDAIKSNGYKWNAGTKTLEKLIKPKFKVGDRIKDKNNKIWFVVQVSDKHFSISSVPNAEGYFVPIGDQNDYELIPNKFDINTLKPFDKVLVAHNKGEWHIQFFEKYSPTSKFPFICIGGSAYQKCVPYEENKHLMDTTNDCDEYYKIWE